MFVKKLTQANSAYPSLLRSIPNPPKQLFFLGSPPSDWDDKPKVAIVGSRHVTPYGKQVAEKFSRELAEQGVCIISGLALGIDAIAHQAALSVGGGHIAVLPTGLKTIYPATNRNLAAKLIEHGGCIVSEFDDTTPSLKHTFILRNRIVSGMADALLIIEAAEKSGTLHTARFALEQGKDVLVVPGNITSPNSAGTNTLIKSGAIPVTSSADILEALHLQSGLTAALDRKSVV